MRFISMLLVVALGSPALAQARELTTTDVEALVVSLREIRTQMDSAWEVESEAERTPHGVAIHRELNSMRNRLVGRDGWGTALVRTGVDTTIKNVHGQKGFLHGDLEATMGQVCTLEVALRDLVSNEFKHQVGAFAGLATCRSTGPSSKSGQTTSPPQTSSD